MCGIMIDEKSEQKLIKLGVKDSKLLTPEVRESMYEKILKIAAKEKTIIIPADEIDNRGIANLNLNQLEAVKTAQIINALKPDKAIVDCPSNNIKEYTAYLRKLIDNNKIDLICEHKADFKYPVVSAASIIAKVARDREIEKIKKEHNIEFGSGYTSDPRTQDFLEKNHNDHRLKHIFRHTWDTLKQAAIKKQQKKLFDFGDDDFKQDTYTFENRTEEDIKKLVKEHGFIKTEPKTKYEKARIEGICTVVLYTTGKMLIQGKKDAVGVVRKIIET